MKDEPSVFDDIMQGLHEIQEYQKGNISLRSHVATIPDDEVEIGQLLFHKFHELSKANKQRVIMYTDELLQAN